MTPEGNQKVTIEDDLEMRTIVYDRQYRIRDYFKPSMIEASAFIAEAYFVSAPLFAVAKGGFRADSIVALCIAALPQITTYVLGRIYDVFGRDNHLKEMFRAQKLPSPYMRKLEDRIEKIVP